MCDPAIDAHAYHFDVADCRTWRSLVSKTSHLMGKNWFTDTDWDSLLGAADRNEGTRLKPVS